MTSTTSKPVKSKSKSSRASTRTSSRTKRKKRSKTRPDPASARGERLQPFALGLGGNLGDVEATLTEALARLSDALGPLEVASLYRSAAVSSIPQPDYLNTAAVGRTSLPPDAVLALAKQLELEAGRCRSARGAPRPLDIDLLLYADQVSSLPELTLPHPRLASRRFVLEPLAQVAGEWRVPPEGDSVRRRLEACGEGRVVERIDWSR